MEKMLCSVTALLFLLAICVYLYFLKGRWTPYVEGTFNGQRYIYHMTINMRNSKSLKVELYGHEEYLYPKQVLDHLYDNQELYAYVINLDSKILAIRKNAISSIEMTITDTFE